MRVTIYPVSHRNETCMNCGKEGTRFEDMDQQFFCGKKCAEFWHGSVAEYGLADESTKR